MCGWLLTLAGAWRLAAFTERQPAARSRPAMRVARAPDGSTDWLVLPGVTWDDDDPAGNEPGNFASPAPGAGAARTHGFAWLSAACGAAAECAIYGSMAAGGRPTSLIGLWPLAVMTVISVAIAELLSACRAAVVTGGHGREVGRSNAVRRLTGSLLSPPVGVRALLAAGGFALAGAQGALLAVLAVETIAIACTGALIWKITPAGVGPARRCAAAGPRTKVSRTPGTKVTAVVGVTGPAGTSARVRITTTGPGAGAGTAVIAGTGAVASPVPVDAPFTRDAVLFLRDDGAAARWAGRLVQGNLIPLPPALAGLVATVMLAALGLRNLPGFIALTPPVVMMLAAPGSSHRHDGRFDWLVPVLLASAQYVYLATLGFALAVPGPVIFSACALTFVRYAGIAVDARAAAGRGHHVDADRAGADRAGPDQAGAGSASFGLSSVVSPGPASAGPGSGIGWETRMFAAGLAATFGLATFGYLGLATYLGALICRKVVIGYLVPREEHHR